MCFKSRSAFRCVKAVPLTVGEDEAPCRVSILIDVSVENLLPAPEIGTFLCLSPFPFCTVTKKFSKSTSTT